MQRRSELRVTHVYNSMVSGRIRQDIANVKPGVVLHSAEHTAHANTQVPAHRCDQLERLIRYTARGAVSLERLAQDANGDLVSTFTHPWSDGTTGIRLSPLELLEKLTALVPLPRVHLVRYGGSLAPHSHLRSAIMPTTRQQGEEETDTGLPCWSWARLLKCVFALDMARCP